MDFGIVQIISLLMGLSGFSVGTNPTAPTADQALQYAMPDADITVHFDAGSVIPNNYKVLTNLPNQPQIKAQPELAKMVRKAIAEVDGPRGVALTMTGIDVTKDISDATAFFKIVPNHDPNMVVAVHGKFSATNIDKIAKVLGKGSVKVGGGAWVDTGDGNAVAVTKNGVMLAGSSQLVKDRMADTWKAPAITSGNLASVAEVLGAKPVFAVALTLSADARSQLLGMHQDQNFVTDLIKRGKFASFAVYKDGLGWTWIDSTRQGMDSMNQVSDGMIDLLRAGQIAPRGFAKIVIGSLDSYRGQKQVDDLIKHKSDILKLVDTYTGDGQFKAAVSADPKTNKLSVRLTGRSLSEVVPLGGMLPGIAAAMVFRIGAPQSTTPMAIPSPTPLPPPPPPVKRGTPPKHP